MDAYHAYIPVLVCSVSAFALMTFNPTFLQGKQYGDQPAKRPDPLVTSIIIFLIGALIVWLMESKVLTLGGACYRY